MHKDVKRIIYTESELAARAKDIGKKISADFAGQEVVLFGILSGSVIFLADVMRNIDIDCTIDFIDVKSYIGTVSGEPRFTKELSNDIEGKNVILVEDILDTGKTLAFVKKAVLAQNPKTVKICTLLNKKIEKSADVQADYIGFDVDNVFVVGYGLDYSQKYRNLPYIAEIKEEAITD